VAPLAEADVSLLVPLVPTAVEVDPETPALDVPSLFGLPLPLVCVLAVSLLVVALDRIHAPALAGDRLAVDVL